MFTAVNTWGLLVLTVLLGYGLVEVPRSLWNASRRGRSLNYCYFKAAKLYSDMCEAADTLAEMKEVKQRERGREGREKGEGKGREGEEGNGSKSLNSCNNLRRMSTCVQCTCTEHAIPHMLHYTNCFLSYACTHPHPHTHTESLQAHPRRLIHGPIAQVC